MSTWGKRRRQLFKLTAEIVQSWDDDGVPGLDPLGRPYLHVELNNFELDIHIERAPKRWTWWGMGGSFGWRTPVTYIEGYRDTGFGDNEISGDFPERRWLNT